MALFDLLGRRWSMRILWELRDDGVPTFRDLQTRCGAISSSVLNRRLHELREARLVTSRDSHGYGLTAEGRELLLAWGPLDAWAQRWVKALERSDAPQGRRRR